jgi:hypothetical protein
MDTTNVTTDCTSQLDAAKPIRLAEVFTYRDEPGYYMRTTDLRLFYTKQWPLSDVGKFDYARKVKIEFGRQHDPDVEFSRSSRFRKPSV